LKSSAKLDEAHLIAPQTFTDLRLLISSIDEQMSLKILLCGQEKLSQTLKRSSHADLL
jgi:type II secretory pathway predicted ATPase ExeA